MLWLLYLDIADRILRLCHNICTCDNNATQHCNNTACRSALPEITSFCLTAVISYSKQIEYDALLSNYLYVYDSHPFVLPGNYATQYRNDSAFNSVQPVITTQPLLSLLSLAASRQNMTLLCHNICTCDNRPFMLTGKYGTQRCNSTVLYDQRLN